MFGQEPLLNVGYWYYSRSLYSAIRYAKLLVVSLISDINQSHSNVYHELRSVAKETVKHLQLRKFNSHTPLIHYIFGFANIVLVLLTSVSTEHPQRRFYISCYTFLQRAKSSLSNPPFRHRLVPPITIILTVLVIERIWENEPFAEGSD